MVLSGRDMDVVAVGNKAVVNSDSSSDEHIIRTFILSSDLLLLPFFFTSQRGSSRGDGSAKSTE